MSIQAVKPLRFRILHIVEERAAKGDPVGAVTGPRFASSIKEDMQLWGVNGGVICYELKRLVADGEIERQLSTELYVSTYGSCSPRFRPMANYVPATPV